MNMTQLVVNIIQVVMKITQCVFNLKECVVNISININLTQRPIRPTVNDTEGRNEAPKSWGGRGGSHACSMMTASSDFKAWFSRQSEKATTEDLCLPNKALLHCYIAFSMCRSVYHIQHIVDIYRYSTIAWGRFVVVKQQRMAEHANESKINIALHIITL